QGGPHRPQLDRPLLGDGGHACGQAAAEGDQHNLHRRDTLVLRGELQRMVDVVAEPRVVLLLVAEAVERLNIRAAVRAVDPRHRRTPLELRDLRGIRQSVPHTQQRFDVDAVVDGGLGCGHVVPPSRDAGLHSIDRPTDMESDVGPVLHGVYLLDEFGYELGGAGRTIGLDVAVADGLAGQFGDAGGDEVRGRWWRNPCIGRRRSGRAGGGRGSSARSGARAGSTGTGAWRRSAPWWWSARPGRWRDRMHTDAGRAGGRSHAAPGRLAGGTWPDRFWARTPRSFAARVLPS